MKHFKRLTTPLLLVLLLVLAACSQTTAPAPELDTQGQTKVAVCHLDDEGVFVPISVADPAVDAHLAHGDLVVGEEIDADCNLVEPEQDTDDDGVIDAQDNCPTVANPDQLNRYGSPAGDACEDLDGDGTLDVDEANFCLSIDGELLISKGTAVCVSSVTTGTEPNVAVANGAGAGAFAGADGGGTPFLSNNSTATAIGDGARAVIYLGDNNTASAEGINAIAVASDGNNNTSTATGDNTFAGTEVGDNNTARATGDGASAEASNGDNNTASAEGINATAQAFFGNNNSATSTGVYTCAGGGDSDEVAVNENLCF